MPILKQLVNNSNQSKRRSRADLTTEMISAPLGDFRHTMHIGRGGDAFGDTSFLSSRSGEAPREAETKHNFPHAKKSLLSRTFRSSKRTQSVNHGDKYEYMTAPSSSSTYVKNAISLPYLNEEDTNKPHHLTKSVSSSPMKMLPEIGNKPANGAAAMATLDPEFTERNFGELTDLPASVPKGGGMKHAESIMSFNIDLGPSMLGDILSVMEKKGLEDDDLGYEEGRGNESPSHIPHIDDDVEGQVPARARIMYQQKAVVDPYTPDLHVRNNRHNLDSCSVSSTSSAVEEKPHYNPHDGDTDSAKYSSPRGEDDFTFMDDDDDEIRV
ncbi:cdc42 effector protein 4 [Brachionichthys hirsutus]|uniref:cdc42 effector protein 4 n=1 Tax=Brachionichthys hirsutus TaxID=412623 RepID=UPI00360436D4